MPRFDTYADTLDFLFRQLPMFQREGPVAFKKDLTNIHALLDRLGRPEGRFPSIHIAGTNGKGSVAHMMAAMLQARGLKVGLYTSPHYLDFRERIKIDGTYISPDAVVDFVRRTGEALDAIRPSFFEISVAMAFEHFARREVDIAVIETGLGGRLDSTNVLTPLLSVITNISYDHQAFLGDTLPEIAYEKAGIIKPGVPAVVGETHPETEPVFRRRAEALDAPLLFADQQLRTETLEESFSHTLLRVERNGEPFLDRLLLDVAGPYQPDNARTALRSVLLLPGHLRPGEAALRDGLARIRPLTRFMGRWQVLSERPLVLCDSAHNVGGLQRVMDRLRATPHENLHVVLGALKDKPVMDFLPLFPAEARYYFARPDIPRGMDADALRRLAAEQNLAGEAYESVALAFQRARQRAGADDVIFVGGSIFVVAEVLAVAAPVP